MLAALFEFLQKNREVMRIAFATAFAARGELPEDLNYLDKGWRNFELVHDLIKRAQAAGELTRQFESRELAFGIFGLMNIYVMSHLVAPDRPLTRQTAGRVVDLFFAGAAGKATA